MASIPLTNKIAIVLGFLSFITLSIGIALLFILKKEEKYTKEVNIGPNIPNDNNNNNDNNNTVDHTPLYVTNVSDGVNFHYDTYFNNTKSVNIQTSDVFPPESKQSIKFYCPEYVFTTSKGGTEQIQNTISPWQYPPPFMGYVTSTEHANQIIVNLPSTYNTSTSGKELNNYTGFGQFNLDTTHKTKEILYKAVSSIDYNTVSLQNNRITDVPQGSNQTYVKYYASQVGCTGTSRSFVLSTDMLRLYISYNVKQTDSPGNKALPFLQSSGQVIVFTRSPDVPNQHHSTSVNWYSSPSLKLTNPFGMHSVFLESYIDPITLKTVEGDDFGSHIATTINRDNQQRIVAIRSNFGNSVKSGALIAVYEENEYTSKHNLINIVSPPTDKPRPRTQEQINGFGHVFDIGNNYLIATTSVQQDKTIGGLSSMLSYLDVFVRDKTENKWVYSHTVNPPTTAINDGEWFGTSIVTSENNTMVLIGSPSEAGGSIYLYGESANSNKETVFTQKQRIQNPYSSAHPGSFGYFINTDETFRLLSISLQVPKTNYQNYVPVESNSTSQHPGVFILNIDWETEVIEFTPSATLSQGPLFIQQNQDPYTYSLCSGGNGLQTLEVIDPLYGSTVSMRITDATESKARVFVNSPCNQRFEMYTIDLIKQNDHVSVSSSTEEVSITEEKEEEKQSALQDSISFEDSSRGLSLSSDGNTLATGIPGYNTNNGAAQIFTRSGSTWTQQGDKLVGTGAIGSAQQGRSVSLSSDGNTLAVGGYFDNLFTGATWIFTRSGSTWTQQGNKLVGTGASGTSAQGNSISLSSDGNTLAVGGYFDNSSIGATWIFTRSGSTWTQQGNKLVGTGASGTSRQGYSISLSSDGNTLAVGGYGDNSSTGATWIFTRSGSTWTQQGNKLVGTGASGNAQQGITVSLSSDGNTLAVGGYKDNSSIGATWVFTRSGSTWTQQGNKLVGTGAIGNTQQGGSISLSSDGNILVVGGAGDNSYTGASWIFTRSGSTWTQQGDKLVRSGSDAFGSFVTISSGGNTIAIKDNSNVWMYTYD